MKYSLYKPPFIYITDCVKIREGYNCGPHHCGPAPDHKLTGPQWYRTTVVPNPPGGSMEEAASAAGVGINSVFKMDGYNCGPVLLWSGQLVIRGRTTMVRTTVVPHPYILYNPLYL